MAIMPTYERAKELDIGVMAWIGPISTAGMERVEEGVIELWLAEADSLVFWARVKSGPAGWAATDTHGPWGRELVNSGLDGHDIAVRVLSRANAAVVEMSMQWMVGLSEMESAVSDEVMGPKLKAWDTLRQALMEAASPDQSMVRRVPSRKN